MRQSILLTGLFFLATTTLSAEAPKANHDFYEKTIRPLFLDHCVQCHGDKKVRGKLRVDSRAALLKGGESGPALVPGKPEASLLMKVLSHTGEIKMPQKGKLSAKQIAAVEKWIKMGAPAPEGKVEIAQSIDWKKARSFWSFQPVKRPAVPAVKNTAWGRNSIDRFLLAKMEPKGLKPVAEADRRTLIRRVTFDLIGLPPTPEEVEAFVNDKRPGAYERVVDRLLANPHHGERWGRHWLDVARYAEDQAHTFAVKPNFFAWRYRDWVVDSINDDLPYDRFVKYQIAADLLPEKSIADRKHRAALGFFGLGAQYYKNTDAAKAAADELDDRIDTLSKAFLGLTVSCARCHDHKFDPIPTIDYYSLAGIFSSTRLNDVSLASDEEQTRYRTAQAKVQAADKAMQEFQRDQRLTLARGKVKDVSVYLIAAWKVRVKKLSNPRYSPSVQAREDKLDAGTLDRMVKLLEPNNKLAQGHALLTPWRTTFIKKSDTVPDEVTKAAQALQERLEKALKTPASLPVQQKGKKKPKGNADTPLVNAFFGDQGAFAVPVNELARHLDASAKSKLTSLQDQLNLARKAMPPAPAIAHGLSDTGGKDVKVFLRGNPKTPGETAPRRFLRILAGDDAPKFTKGSGRLELAEAIASKDNPLTARVIVNRVWANHFGRGIVNTPSNFGSLGDKPTHPELLDWLTDEFTASGWSMKHLHRLIVLSSAYRMSSTATTEGEAKDPDNVLLWRLNRRRLDVESFRDAILAVSGELIPNLGGPTLALNDGNKRRTVYAKISRHELDGLLRLFDFPDANISSEKRIETTVPQQQLFILNSPFVQARAKALAGRLQKAANDDAGRLRLAYQLVYGRLPDDDEQKLGLAYLALKDDTKGPSAQLTRWERYAQVLLAGNEFLYVD